MSITPTITKDVVNTQVEDVKVASAAATATAQPVTSNAPIADTAAEDEYDDSEVNEPKDNSVQTAIDIPQEHITEADVECMPTDVEVMDPDNIPDRMAEGDDETTKQDDSMLMQMNSYIDQMKEKSYLTWCYLKNEADIQINGKNITIPVNSSYLKNQVKLIMDVVLDNMQKYYGQEFVLDIPIAQEEEVKQMIDWSNPDEIYKYIVEKNHKINDFKIMLNLNMEY